MKDEAKNPSIDHDELMSAYTEYAAGSTRALRRQARAGIGDDLDHERRYLVARDPMDKSFLSAPPHQLHHSLHSALTEAERLAKKEGAIFQVYQATHRVYIDNTIIERL